jgi:hypothetical protein
MGYLGRNARVSTMASALAVLVCGALVVAVDMQSAMAASPTAGLRPARADDAVRACGATSIDEINKEASVPVEYVDGYFMSVPTATDPVELLCGNGKTSGAVHIEVKHDVPNWSDALNCMENVIVHGKAAPGRDRIEYTWLFGHKVVVVVVSEYSVITAYPTDGLEETWIECSAAA